MKKERQSLATKHLISITLQIVSLIILFAANMFTQEIWVKDEKYGGYIHSVYGSAQNIPISFLESFVLNTWCAIIGTALLSLIIYCLISSFINRSDTEYFTPSRIILPSVKLALIILLVLFAKQKIDYEDQGYYILKAENSFYMLLTLTVLLLLHEVVPIIILKVKENREIKVLAESYQSDDPDVPKEKEKKGPQLEVIARPLSECAYCRLCGNELNGSNVCEDCGTTITEPGDDVIRCFNCSSGLPSDSLHCPFCGMKVN